MRTLLSFPCQLGLGVVLRHCCLSSYMSIDPVKVSRVQEWPTLENWTDIQVFLEFANFYC